MLVAIVHNWVISVAYAGFSKGEGPGNSENLKINEDQNENFPAQNQVRLPPQN